MRSFQGGRQFNRNLSMWKRLLNRIDPPSLRPLLSTRRAMGVVSVSTVAAHRDRIPAQHSPPILPTNKNVKANGIAAMRQEGREHLYIEIDLTVLSTGSE